MGGPERIAHFCMLMMPRIRACRGDQAASPCAPFIPWIRGEELEGLEVYIDGRPAGQLQRLGNSFKTGLEVDDGEHAVSVSHPDYECRPSRVFTGVGGQKLYLILDTMETNNDYGESETVLYFQR